MISGSRRMLADEVDRHGIVKVFTRIDTVLLPDDAPDEVVSAWLRLHGQGVRDIKTVEDWLNNDKK